MMSSILEFKIPLFFEISVNDFLILLLNKLVSYDE